MVELRYCYNKQNLGLFFVILDLSFSKITYINKIRKKNSKQFIVNYKGEFQRSSTYLNQLDAKNL